MVLKMVPLYCKLTSLQGLDRPTRVDFRCAITGLRVSVDETYGGEVKSVIMVRLIKLSRVRQIATTKR